MSRTVVSQYLGQARRLLVSPEMLVVAAAVLVIEVIGPASKDDVDDIPWVLLPAILFLFGCQMARHRSLPLTAGIVDVTYRVFRRLRRRLVLSLGLDFHPERSPRLTPFTGLRRGVMALGLTAAIVFPARGILRELLALCRDSGLYTVFVLALGAVWAVLLAGITVQIPAAVLDVLEVLKRRVNIEGPSRVVTVIGILVLVGVLLVTLDEAVGLEGCLIVLAFACMLPSVLSPVDPPRGPWLNIAMGENARPTTARLGELIRDGHRLLALEAFVLVCLLVPAPGGDGGPDPFPVTDLLLRVYGWIAAWLFTGGAVLAITEFNRRRRLYDPAYPRSRVLWALPGEETDALTMDRAAIEAAGWRLVRSQRMPTSDDADLLVGSPRVEPGPVRPSSPVPLSRIPPALFLLSSDPGSVLGEAEERDKADRALGALERLLTASRPRQSDRGEGTFLVPHCWLVVGLTRDDERGGIDRTPPVAVGHSFQSALGTRLRRFLYEVMDRAGVDVFYVEDAVTPVQVSEVLGLLFDRHIARTDPPQVSEHDFVGITGVRVVLHDVDPETEGLAGVDSHVTRNAISRARIMIIGRDRRDGDDDDDPPVEGESTDLWLEEALRRMFPRPLPV